MAVAGVDSGAVRGDTEDDVLAPYVPRLAAEWPEDAGAWRLLDGTLVFADISGFTALSERLARHGRVGAEELTEVLGRCFEALLADAYARGGSLLKFGGDALLLLFDGDDHAERGVAAAIAMRETMRAVGRLTTSVGQVRLRMSLGVHSGELHVFSVGGSHRELLVTGPGASTVVAMEGTAEAGEIVVSPATAAQVAPSLLAAPKGPGVLLRARAVAAPADGDAFPPRAPSPGLAAHLPVALRRHLADGGQGSEHRTASIAFVHFDGTDHALVERGAGWVADELDRLVRATQEAADREEVTFLASDIDADGGKLILVTGVPRTLGDDEGRILRAVREIATGERGLPVRIGVNRGPVFAGAVGPPYRQTFTVMGDAVNLAARLMAKAQPGQVLVSQPVLDRSRSAFSSVPLEPFLVKGKRRPVTAYAVGAESGVREVRRASHHPLVGRGPELVSLTEGLAAATAGRGQVVELTGDPGIGKSRLLDEIRERAAAGDARTISVQCEQYHSATPFFAAGLLLAAALGGTDDIALRVARLDPELAAWSPLVADVLRVELRDNERTRPLDPQFRRRRAVEVAVRLLTLAFDGATVLALDDVHWMDDASAEVVTALARAATERPWLLVIARRPDAGGLRLAEGPGVACHRLETLPDDDARRLVVAAARAPLPPDRADAVIRRGGGNPLFLEELARIASTDGTTGDDLPEDVEAVVALQLDELSGLARRVVGIASVLGSSFRRELLHELLADPVAGVDLDVDGAIALAADHLRLEVDGRLRFRHRLVRDVAYSLLPFRRRRDLHAVAADAIAASADSPATVDEILSLHLLHAGRYDASRRHATTAGRRALRRCAVVEAEQLYERAIEAAQRSPRKVPVGTVAGLWSQLGRVRQLKGDYAGADAAYRRARALQPSGLALARLAIRHAEVAERQGRTVAEARWIQRGLRALRDVDAPEAAAERANLWCRHASLRWRAGAPREALRSARRAIAEAESSTRRDARAALANALTLCDFAHHALGRADLAVNLDRALRIYRDLRDRNNVANLLNNAGAFAYWAGRWDEALERYDEARRTFERIGNLVDAALGSANIAEIFADQGRLDDAEALLEETVALWRSMDFPIGLARATRHLARVRVRRGDAGSALALFEEARATFASSGLVANVHEVDVWRAECLLRLGRTEEADRLLQAALAHEVSVGGTEMRCMIHRLRSAVAVASGDLETAWAEVDESLALARSRGSAYDVALGLETLSVLARLGGRPWDEDARRERDELLRSLGVVSTPQLPLPEGWAVGVA